MTAPKETHESLHAEIEAWRQRATIAEQRAELYQQMIMGLPLGIMIYQLEDPDDPASLRLVSANRAMRPVSGFALDAEAGRRITEIFPNALESGLAQIYAAVARTGEDRDLGEVEYGDDRVAKGLFAVRAFSLRPDSVGITVDNITQRRRTEAALRENMETIQAQAAALVELSTPLIPLSEHMVVMPLIGTIDSQRAHQVTKMLLEGISTRRARLAILDITGVQVVDTQVASAIVQAAKAVRLLGAQVVLTGIRAEVAQTLVALGTDLGDIVICSNLQSGIAYARTQGIGAGGR